MMDAPLFVERRDRFGSRQLAARCPYRGERDIAVDHPECRLYHIAALVDFADDAVGTVRPIGVYGDLGPFDGSISA